MEQKIQYDYSLLRGRIRELFGTEKRFAEEMNKSEIGMSAGAFSNKINGKSDFTQPEISVMCRLLNITENEIPTHFFKQKYELNS